MEHHILPKMTYIDFKNWFFSYKRKKEGKYRDIRLGQAFLNDNYPCTVNPDVFYETIESKTIGLIFSSYIIRDTIPQDICGDLSVSGFVAATIKPSE